MQTSIHQAYTIQNREVIKTIAELDAGFYIPTQFRVHIDFGGEPPDSSASSEKTWQRAFVTALGRDPNSKRSLRVPRQSGIRIQYYGFRIQVLSLENRGALLLGMSESLAGTCLSIECAVGYALCVRMQSLRTHKHADPVRMS